MIGTKGVETTAGSKILAGYVPVYDSTVAARCKGAWPAAARQDEHRRVRDGLVDRELGVRAFPQPVGSLARAGRLGRRLGGGRLRGPRAVGARLGHRRLDQAALGALRERRAAADLRHRLALRDRRVRVVARPGRAGREDGARLRVPLLGDRRPRPGGLDDGGRAARSRCPRPADGPEGPADRRAGRDARRARDRARRRATRSRGRSRSRRSWAPRSRSARCRARSSTGCPATT